MMNFDLYIFCCLLFVSCAGRGAGESKSYGDAHSKGAISGKVTRIADGDTFHMLLEDKRSIKIRLFGIDCPEAQQPFYQQAKNELAKMIFNKTITITWDQKDKYGRYLATAFADGKSVNEMMLSRGMAWHFTRYDNNSKWAALHQQARKKRLGIWSQPNPIAPWKFRKNK